MAGVSLVRCAGYEDAEALQGAVEQAVAPFGGLAAMARSGERVLLKPNFVVARPAEAAVNTHPRLIEAVARLCLDRGARVVVADSPAVVPAGRVAARTGLLELLAPLGVPVIDLGRSRRVVRRLPLSRCTVKLAADVLEADAVINLAKLKVHSQLVLTLAVKNLFGAVVARRKALLHALLGSDPDRFGVMLLEVAALVAPRINLVDGVVGLERNGPTSGHPRRFGLLAAGTDAVAVDRVLCAVLGVEAEELPTYRAARRHNLGTWQLERIETFGEAPEHLCVPDLARAIPMPIGFSVPHLVRGLARHLAAYWQDRRQAGEARPTKLRPGA